MRKKSGEKLWYVVFFADGGVLGWRLWIGAHPMYRLLDSPDETIVFYQQIPTSCASDIEAKFSKLKGAEATSDPRIDEPAEEE